MTQQYPVNVLVFAASLRRASLNNRLATLAAKAVEKHGGTVRRAQMTDFDCPSYDGDEETAGTMPEGAVRLKDQIQPLCLDLNCVQGRAPRVRRSSLFGIECGDARWPRCCL